MTNDKGPVTLIELLKLNPGGNTAGSINPLLLMPITPLGIFFIALVTNFKFLAAVTILLLPVPPLLTGKQFLLSSVVPFCNVRNVIFYILMFDNRKCLINILY